MHKNKNFLLQIPPDLIDQLDTNLNIQQIENKFYVEISTSIYNNREQGKIQLAGEEFDLQNIFYCEITDGNISLLPVEKSANLILNPKKVEYKNCTVENASIKNYPYKINSLHMERKTEEPVADFIFKRIIFNDEELLKFFPETDSVRKVVEEMSDLFFNRRILKTKFYHKCIREKRDLFLQNITSDILTRSEFENLTANIPYREINFVNEIFELKNEYFYLKSSPKIILSAEEKIGEVQSEMEKSIRGLFKRSEILKKRDVQNLYSKWGRAENEEYKRIMEKIAISHGNFWMLKK